MNELISKRDAIEAANRADYTGLPITYVRKVTDEVVKALVKLPPVQRWIPLSERPPQGQTEVIVSCCDDSGDSKYDYTACGWMTKDGEYWIVDNEINYDVVAWMPLPEPYAERRNNDL